MYGAKYTSATAAAGGTATLTHGALNNVWWLFAAVTLLFVAVAAVQLVRRPLSHRP
jgi:hypothetical protein